MSATELFQMTPRADASVGRVQLSAAFDRAAEPGLTHDIGLGHAAGVPDRAVFFPRHTPPVSDRTAGGCRRMPFTPVLVHGPFGRACGRSGLMAGTFSRTYRTSAGACGSSVLTCGCFGHTDGWFGHTDGSSGLMAGAFSHTCGASGHTCGASVPACGPSGLMPGTLSHTCGTSAGPHGTPGDAPFWPKQAEIRRKHQQ